MIAVRIVRAIGDEIETQLSFWTLGPHINVARRYTNFDPLRKELAIAVDDTETVRMLVKMMLASNITTDGQE